VEFLKTQEEADEKLMMCFIGKDMKLKTEYGRLKLGFYKKKTDSELVADYSFAVRIYDEFQQKRDWEVSLICRYYLEYGE
jgi:hypothetical protein